MSYYSFYILCNLNYYMGERHEYKFILYDYWR